jgi:DNA helicase-2/ATP-dependent DNA helicase PcrA
VGVSFQGLNPAQVQAITSESPVILTLAGAGSGKTTVLTGRIAHLTEQRISTSSMLALTFTRLAGKEMKERVIRLVGETQGRKLFCNTFHAFCVKVVREYGYLVGRDPHFSIYDENDRDGIIKRIVQDLSSKAKVCEVIDHLYEPMPPRAVAREVAEYHYRLKQHNAVDLDGLLYEAKAVLAHPGPKQGYRNQYRHVFVDEFQDTNDVQLEIIRELNPENLFVVGDDFQAIYGWRGGNVDIILDFPKHYPGCEVIRLEDNYRSTAEIVMAANNLISHNERQTEKVLRAQRDGSEPRVSQFAGTDEELKSVSNAIIGLVAGCGDIRSHSDIAVLARTNSQLEAAQDAFREVGIPTLWLSHKADVFTRPDIRGILAWISAASNMHDNIAVRIAARFPVKQVSDLVLEQAELEATESEGNLPEALREHHLKDSGVRNFLFLLDQVAAELAIGMTPGEAIDYVQNGLGLLDHYDSLGLRSRNEDLQEAIRRADKWAARQIELGESTDTQAFLRWLRIRHIQDRLIEENSDAVRLTTVHGAKGLEWPVVFVIGLNDGTFPHKNGDIEEERRLFYVAITRAKNMLFLSRAGARMVPYSDKPIIQEPSPFLDEIQQARSA